MIPVRALAIVMLGWSVVASAAPQHKRRTTTRAPEVAQSSSVNLDLPPAPPPAVIEPTPQPVAARVVREDRGRERRWGLFAGGLVLFLSGYALDIGLSYGLGHDPAGTSLIPVVGPLVQMGDSWAMVKPSTTGNPMVDAQANQQIDQVNHTIQQAAYAVLAIDFVLQLAGTTMAVVGAVGTRRTVETNRNVAVIPTGNGVMVKF